METKNKKGGRGFIFENDEKPTLLDEHISKIADRLEVTIDYLVRGEDVKTDSLTHDEIDLINDFRKMIKEGKKIIASNIKLIVGG